MKPQITSTLILCLLSAAQALPTFSLIDSFKEEVVIADQHSVRGINLSPISEREAFVNTSFLNWKLSVESYFSHTNSGPVKLLGTNAYTHSLLRQNDGLQSSNGNMGLLGLDSDLRLFDLLKIKTQTYFRPRSNHESYESNSYYYSRDLYVELMINRFSLQAGKIARTWGHGRIQHMVFSNDHEPLKMIRLSNNEAVELPGFLKSLGSMKFDLFWSRLDNTQPYSEPDILGSFTVLKPHKRFEWGFGQTVIFGGTGSPTKNPLVFLSEGFSPNNNTTNRNFLISLSWIVPQLEVELYNEIMIEDCCGKTVWDPLSPRNGSHLFGMYIPELGQSKNSNLTLEWIRTSHIAYRHGIYTSGYTYNNQSLGAPLGPDANGTYVRFRHMKERSIFYIQLSHEIRSKTGEASSFGAPIPIETEEPVFQAPEQRSRMEIGYTLKLKNNFELLSGLGIEHALNHDYQKYMTKTFYSLSAGIRKHL